MGLHQNLYPLLEFESLQALMGLFKIKGIKQYLRRLQRYRNWQKPEGVKTIKWGHEIEGNFLRPNQNGTWELCKQDWTQDYTEAPFPMQLQYGSWMFETVPSQPFNTDSNLSIIIATLRRQLQFLKTKERIPLFIPNVPLIGLLDSKNETNFVNNYTQSQYIDDSYITNHPRCLSSTECIRKRRGSKVEMFAPIYYDKNTKQKELNLTELKEGFIYMDATIFGSGLCNLQATFSTKNLDHARYTHDQLNVIGPIYEALTAGSPFIKGKIANSDGLWDIYNQSNDDRTPSQRDPKSPDYLPKPRGSFSQYYLWDSPINRPEYNDIFTGAREQDLEQVRKIAQQINVQVDQKIVFHLATLFRRYLTKGYDMYKDISEEEITIYQSLSGAVYHSIRMKPPMDDNMGWLLEFRPMEMLLKPDQNAAVILSLHLIVRLLHENEKINWYIPISKLEENYARCQKKDAVLKERFFFRTNVYDQGEPVIEELTAKEILFGKGGYKGIMHEVDCALESSLKLCEHSRELIQCIKQFLFEKVSGERPTLAAWMRKYVDGHPDYLHNSILPRSTIDDMLKHLYKIQVGEVEDKAFSKIFPSWVPSEPTAFPECCQNYVKL